MTDHLSKAQECSKRAQESFDRCDTDGFVSQWANDIMGQLHQARHELEQNGNKAPQPVLWDNNEDAIVEAKLIHGQYGPVFLLSPRAEEKYGRRFVPYGSRSRVQRNLGLSQPDLVLPSYADLHGTGTGLAGATSVRVVIRPDYKEMGWEW